MISCIAIDDEPLALEVLKKYIGQAPELKLLHAFTDAIDAVDFLRNKPVDLILLDINMPDINGLQLYLDLPVKPLVIFTTAHKEYAVDGFEVNAVDYLLKPFNLDRFQKAVEKVGLLRKNGREDNSGPQYLYINSEHKMIKIVMADIIYIEALDNYVRINTTQQSYLTLSSLKSILEKLPKEQFTRIHRAYIVANDKISFFQYRKLGLVNKVELPVGDTYRNEISLKKKEL